MATIFALSFIIFLLLSLVGLFKPSWVFRWGEKRTRLRAFALYFALAICSLVAVNVTTEATTENAKENLANEQGTPSEEQMLKAYCAREAEAAKLHKQAEEMFGVNPHENLQPGQTLVISEQTPAAPECGAKGKSVAQSMELIDSLVTLSEGTEIVIRERIMKGDRLFYRVDTDSGESLCILSGAMFWYDTMDRLQEHEEKRSAWIDPKLEALNTKYYTEQGMDVWDVVNNAVKGKWHNQCAELQ